MSKIVERTQDDLQLKKNEVFEPIENVMKEIDEFQPVINLRLSIMRFMKALSFDDVYLKSVRNYKNNKSDIDFFNILKEIRNGSKVINNKK